MSELHTVLDFPLSIGRKILASVPASSPLAQKPSTSNLNKATLDSDPVIIITVLVCFLILALAFTPLLRYGCRGQTVLDPSDAVADTGLQKAVLKELPIIVYTATSKPPPVPTDCPICLAEFAEGENMRVLPKCNHGFHVECIDNWLVSHSSCPMCRHCLNLQSGNKKTRGAAIVQVTESNNSMHIVTEATDSSQAGRAVSPHTETFQRAPQETAVTTPSRLPSPS